VLRVARTVVSVASFMDGAFGIGRHCGAAPWQQVFRPVQNMPSKPSPTMF
jgi:hypothetical protein